MSPHAETRCGALQVGHTKSLLGWAAKARRQPPVCLQDRIMHEGLEKGRPAAGTQDARHLRQRDVDVEMMEYLLAEYCVKGRIGERQTLYAALHKVDSTVRVSIGEMALGLSKARARYVNTYDSGAARQQLPSAPPAAAPVVHYECAVEIAQGTEMVLLRAIEKSPRV